LSALWSYELAFHAMGILRTVALILVAATLPADHGRAEHGKSRPRQIVSLQHVMENDAVKAIAVYMATRGFWRQGFNTFYPLFAVAASGLGEASIGTVVSVYMLGGGLLQIPFGYLADRYPRLPQIVLGSTFAPLVLFAVSFVRHVWVIILSTFAMGSSPPFRAPRSSPSAPSSDEHTEWGRLPGFKQDHSPQGRCWDRW